MADLTNKLLDILTKLQAENQRLRQMIKNGFTHVNELEHEATNVKDFLYHSQRAFSPNYNFPRVPPEQISDHYCHQGIDLNANVAPPVHADEDQTDVPRRDANHLTVKEEQPTPSAHQPDYQPDLDYHGHNENNSTADEHHNSQRAKTNPNFNLNEMKHLSDNMSSSSNKLSMTTSGTQTAGTFLNDLKPHPYLGTWPVDAVLWHSVPSTFGKYNSSEGFLNQELGSLSDLSANPTSRKCCTQNLDKKIEMVISLLSMLNIDDKEDMSEKLLTISSSEDSCTVMRQSGCLPLLIQLLHGSEGDASEEGVRVSVKARQRASLALRNIVHAHSDDKRGKREAKVLGYLENIRAYCDELQKALSEGDEVEKRKTLLCKSDLSPTIFILMRLSYDEDHRHTMCQLGGLHAIAELIQMDFDVHGHKTVPDHITLRRYAGMALTNLSFGDGTNKALLCSMKGFMKALVAQLYSPNESLRQVTASLFRNLSWRADPVSKKALREVGVVTTLMKVAMEAEKESTLKSILSALWNLTSHCSVNKEAICAMDGAISFLVSTLTYNSSSDRFEIIENGGGVLRNISSQIALHEKYRQILRRHNCIQILLQHLKSSRLAIVSNSCGTLWNLSAKNATDQKVLWEMDAVSMLKNLVHSKHKMISMGSTATLKNLMLAKPPGLTCLDSANRSSVPSLHVRKQKALEAEINQNLSETCENIEGLKNSPTAKSDDEQKFSFNSDSSCTPTRLLAREMVHGKMYHSVGPLANFPQTNSSFTVPRSCSIESVRSDISHDRHRSLELLDRSSRLLSSDSRRRYSPSPSSHHQRSHNFFHSSSSNRSKEYNSRSLERPASKHRRKKEALKTPRSDDYESEDETRNYSEDVKHDSGNHRVNYSVLQPKNNDAWYSNRTSYPVDGNNYTSLPKTANYAQQSKLNSFESSYSDDADQLTNFSLRYNEHNESKKDDDAAQHYDNYLLEDDTMKAYYSEGTPRVSAAVSQTDLHQIDRLGEAKPDEPEGKPYHTSYSGASNDHPRADYRNDNKEEVTYRVKHSEATGSRADANPANSDKDAPCPLKIIENVHPDPNASEMIHSEYDQHGADPRNRTHPSGITSAMDTPMMFSRGSSLNSLVSCEHLSICEERSSVCSDCSSFASRNISPSDIPESFSRMSPVAQSSRTREQCDTRKSKGNTFGDDKQSDFYLERPKVYNDEEVQSAVSVSNIFSATESEGHTNQVEEKETDEKVSPIDNDASSFNQPKVCQNNGHIVRGSIPSDEDKDIAEDDIVDVVSPTLPNNSRACAHNNSKLSSRVNKLSTPSFQMASAANPVPLKKNNLRITHGKDSPIKIMNIDVKTCEDDASDSVKVYGVESTPAGLSNAVSFSDLSSCADEKLINTSCNSDSVKVYEMESTPAGLSNAVSFSDLSSCADKKPINTSCNSANVDDYRDSESYQVSNRPSKASENLPNRLLNSDSVARNSSPKVLNDSSQKQFFYQYNQNSDESYSNEVSNSVNRCKFKKRTTDKNLLRHNQTNRPPVTKLQNFCGHNDYVTRVTESEIGDEKRVYAVENTPISISRRSSVDSLDPDEHLCEQNPAEDNENKANSLNTEPTPDEQRLLSECISSAIPKSKPKKKRSRKSKLPRTTYQSNPPKDLQSVLPVDSFSKGISTEAGMVAAVQSNLKDVKMEVQTSPDTDSRSTKSTSAFSSRSMTESKILQMEAEKLIRDVCIDAADDVSASCSSELDQINPPSLMGEVTSVSLCSSVSSEISNSLSFQSNRGPLERKKARKNRPVPLHQMLGANRDVMITSGGSDVLKNIRPPSNLGSVDDLSMKTSFTSEILNDINPPSIMEDVSVTTCANDPPKKAGLTAPKKAPTVAVVGGENGSDAKPTMESSSDSGLLGNLQPPSCFQELSEIDGVSNRAGAQSNSSASDTEIEEELPHDDESTAHSKTTDTSHETDSLGRCNTALALDDRCNTALSGDITHDDDAEKIARFGEPNVNESPIHQIAVKDLPKQWFDAVSECSSEDDFVIIDESEDDIHITSEQIRFLESDANLIADSLKRMSEQLPMTVGESDDFTNSNALIDDERISLVSAGSDSESSKQSAHEQPMEDLPKRPRIVKPINRDVIKSRNESGDQNQPKGIRGRRKPLMGSSRIPAGKNSRTNVIHPTRPTSLKPVVRINKNDVKPFVSSKNISNNNSESFACSFHNNQKRNSLMSGKNSAKSNQISVKVKKNSTDSNAPGPLVKQGTFTKDDVPLQGSAEKNPDRNIQPNPAKFSPKISAGPVTKVSSIPGARRQVKATSHSVPMKRSISNASSTKTKSFKQSPSSQSLRNEPVYCKARARTPSLTSLSGKSNANSLKNSPSNVSLQSDASHDRLSLGRSQVSKKVVKSKIAGLWKRNEADKANKKKVCKTSSAFKSSNCSSSPKLSRSSTYEKIPEVCNGIQPDPLTKKLTEPKDKAKAANKTAARKPWQSTVGVSRPFQHRPKQTRLVHPTTQPKSETITKKPVLKSGGSPSPRHNSFIRLDSVKGENENAESAQSLPNTDSSSDSEEVQLVPTAAVVQPFNYMPNNAQRPSKIPTPTANINPLSAFPKPENSFDVHNDNEANVKTNFSKRFCLITSV